MQNVIFTQLTVAEIRQLLRQELENVLMLHAPQESCTLDTSNQLLTVSQAGLLLNLAVPTIYGLCSKGTIPHFKKGKRLYFSKEALIAWIHSGKKKTTEEIQQEASTYLSTRKRS
ncbi:helix-turn-helix domain-containing protein [Pontibacter sp. H259]|uniref:helix-turn-helix domain-containing protein n=1 Tax=Pontibacter sp. H259 TaxID=3133421 RepID=UPI0030C4DE41